MRVQDRLEQQLAEKITTRNAKAFKAKIPKHIRSAPVQGGDSWTYEDYKQLRQRQKRYKAKGGKGEVTVRSDPGGWSYQYPKGRVVPTPSTEKKLV